MKQTWKNSVRPVTLDGEFARILLNDGTFALIDADLAPSLGQWNWQAYPSTSDNLTVRRNLNPGWLPLADAVSPPPPGHINDHRNGDARDCRRSNLRFATRRNNAQNTRRRPGVEFKGVSKHGDAWRARITVDGQRKSLGTFASRADAARAYDAGARTAFGEFCCVNFPAPGERQA